MTNPSDLESLKVQLIQSVIRFYQKDFTEYYATVIALTEQMPEQINNEIRNAFSHLARIEVATSLEGAREEEKRARGHIERACRDCLKTSFLTVHDRIEDQYNHALIRYQYITPKNVAERKALRDERLSLVKEEARGDENLTKKYEDFLERSLALQVSLEEHYGTAKGKMPMWLCVIYGWIRDGLKLTITKGLLALTAFLLGSAIHWNLIDKLTYYWHILTQ